MPAPQPMQPDFAGTADETGSSSAERVTLMGACFNDAASSGSSSE